MDIDKNTKEKATNQKIHRIINSMKSEGKGFIHSDTDGSYTGTPLDYKEPVQDADDL